MSRETMVWRKGHGCVTKSQAAEIDRKNKKPVVKADFLPKEVERGSWVFRNGKLVPKQKARATDARRASRKRSNHPSPRVMSDIEEHRNMVTGEMVSSRSRHREILREKGLVEVGNESIAKPSVDRFTKDVGQDIKETIEQLKAGNDPHIAENASGVEEVAFDTPADVADGDYIRG